MKKYLLALILLFTLVSCGAPDGEGEQTDGVNPEDHRIFVSSISLKANQIASLATAQVKCTSLASDAGLERQYKAILSTSLKNATAEIDITGSIYMFTSSSNKILIAANVADFWGGSLLNAINRDESFVSVSSENVWSGTDSEGVSTQSGPDDNCNDWSTDSAGESTFYGRTDQIDGGWVEYNSDTCNNSYRIYCISQ